MPFKKSTIRLFLQQQTPPIAEQVAVKESIDLTGLQDEEKAPKVADDMAEKYGADSEFLYP